MMKKYFIVLLFMADLQAAQTMRLARAVKVARELRRCMLQQPVMPAPIAPVPKIPKIPVAQPQPKVQPQPQPKAKSVMPAGELIECPNCGDEKSADDMMQLSCGDVFCKECLAEQVRNAITTRDINALHCMQHVNSLFTEQELRELARFDSTINVAIVLDLLARKYAETIPGYRHCPTLNCPNVFIYEEVPGQRPYPIYCPTCQRRYCPNCLEEHLATLTCAQAKEAKIAKEAKQQEQNQDEDFDYVRCPKCAKGALKGENCMHLMCGAQGGPYRHYYKPELGCGYEFCFGCLRPWSACYNMACDRRDEAKLAAMRDRINSYRKHIQDNERIAARLPGDPYYANQVMRSRALLAELELKFAQIFAEWQAKKGKKSGQAEPKTQPQPQPQPKIQPQPKRRR